MKNMNAIFGMIGIILILIVSGCDKSIFNKGCQKDRKICPDGSGVGRIPPKCEFAECPENLVIAAKLMDTNGINLSLFNEGEFNAEILKVNLAKYDKSTYPNSSDGVHVGLRQSYKTIPFGNNPTFILHFDDGRLNPQVSGKIYLLKGYSGQIINKLSSEYLVFLDSSSLPVVPKVSKEQAEEAAAKSIRKWPAFARDYTVNLAYWADSTNPSEVYLVWDIKAAKGSAQFVINAIDGKVIYDFDGIYT